MANETEYSNIITVAAYVEAEVAPYFRSTAIMPNLVRAFNFDPGSNSKKLPKAGSLVAEIVAESAEATVREYTESSATLSAEKGKVLVELSDEEMEFAARSKDTFTQEQGRALADKFDSDAMALFAGFSNSVGSTGVDLTIAVVQQGFYTLRLNKIPRPYVCAFSPKAVLDLATAIVASSASIWTNPEQISLINGEAQTNGLAGKILGSDVYESTNITLATDHICAIFNPLYALAAGYKGGFKVETERNLSKGTTEMATTFFHDLTEYNDAAGVKVIAGNA